MGHGGDEIWGVPPQLRGRKLYRPFDRMVAGNSYSEYRLRKGFFACPFPLVGAEDNLQIAKIARGPEMKPWRRQGDYDRPLPRRIAESAGARPDSFGVLKIKGEMRLPQKMSRRLRGDFLEYCVRKGIGERDQLPNGLKRLIGQLHEHWARFARQASRSATVLGPSCTVPLRNWAHRYAGKLELHTFHWATDHLISQYREGLARTGSSPPVHRRP